MMERGVCEFCQEPVMDNQVAAFRIRGWEVERAQGGANSILGRERQPDRIVHEACVRVSIRYGAQTSLQV